MVSFLVPTGGWAVTNIIRGTFHSRASSCCNPTSATPKEVKTKWEWTNRYQAPPSSPIVNPWRSMQSSPHQRAFSPPSLRREQPTIQAAQARFARRAKEFPSSAAISLRRGSKSAPALSFIILAISRRVRSSFAPAPVMTPTKASSSEIANAPCPRQPQVGQRTVRGGL